MAAPSAKPRDKKKAMMAPAVSASCGATFLYGDRRTKFRFPSCKGEKTRGVEDEKVEPGVKSRVAMR